MAALARRKDKLDELASNTPGQLTTYVHDVTEYGKVPALFQEVCQQLGGLDLIIYCSGIMPEIGKEEFDFAKDRAIIETNVLGAMAWLDQAAIRLGNVGKGSIVAIGSVAGDRGRKAQPAYHTSKAALATFMESLRNRLGKTGVAVVTIKPGPVDTPMTANTKFKNMMPASKAASIILAKADKNGEHYLSPVHRVIFTIIRNIPSPIFRKLSI